MSSTVLWLFAAVIVMWRLTMAIRQTERALPFVAVFVMIALACMTGATLFYEALGSLVWDIFSIGWAICYALLPITLLLLIRGARR